MVVSTNELATYATERIGESETRMSFSIKDAQTAGVTGKDNWRKYPAAMLRARCIAALSRAVYPDLLMGIYETGESEEIAATPRATARHQPIVEGEVIDAQPVSEVEETDDEKIARWSDLMATAKSAAELLTLGKALKRENISGAVRQVLAAVYDERSKALKPQKAEPKLKLKIEQDDGSMKPADEPPPEHWEQAEREAGEEG
jgi:hypothetical protein